MENKKEKSSLISILAESLKENSMLMVFVLLAVATTFFSGQTMEVSVRDFSTRFFRNFLLIVSLILPINAGIGLNFGIVLGALGSQIALILVLATGCYQSTVLSYLFWGALTIVICIIFGYLLALLFNRTKGQEMISGLFVGFLAFGFYMIVNMVILGGIIKLSDPTLVAKYGEPIKVTINLPTAMFQGLDVLISIPFIHALIAIFVAALVVCGFRTARKVKKGEKETLVFDIAGLVVLIGAFLYIMLNQRVYDMFCKINFPVVTFLLGALVALITWWLLKTKLGHDFMAIRNDMAIAASVGINVDRTRTIAIILSTVFAGLGQLIYIQNVGTLMTYGMHNSLSTFAIAAILIGGATIERASLKNAVIGTFLFHCIYSTAPNATKNLFGNPQIGEYFRLFMCYGVIAVAVVLFAMKEIKAAKERLKAAE